MLDFPNTPAENDTITSEGMSWIYKSGRWVVLGSDALLDTFVAKAGDTVSGQLLHADGGTQLIPWLASLGNPATGFYIGTSGGVPVPSFANDGEASAIIYPAGVEAPTDRTVLTREKGDYRYPIRQGGRVLKKEVYADNTTHSTFSNSTFAAGGPASTFTADALDSLVLVEAVMRVRHTSDASIDDAGIGTGLHFYDGTSYRLCSSNFGVTSSELNSTNVSTGSAHTIRGTIVLSCLFPVAYRRDANRVTARVYYNADYTGEAQIFNTTITYTEIAV